MRRTFVSVAAACALVAAGFAAAPASADPTLESLRLPNTVAAQQGHARFLVGVRLSEPARITVQLINPRDNSSVQTTTDRSPRPAGRQYLRVEAVDDRGFQIPAGPYILRLQPISATGDVGPVLQRGFRLRLNPPHGRFDAYTVPLWRTFRAQAGIPATVEGQLVAVVGPRGPVAAAGLRRGDLITKINGVDVDTPGAHATVMRAMPANRAVPVTYIRNGETIETRVTPKPDWEPAPNYAASLRVATRREPRSLALAYARVRERLDADAVEEARELLDSWPRPWRASAAGQFLVGELLSAQQRWRPAMGAYARAARRENGIATIPLGRAIALLQLGNARRSIGFLALAERIDPKDAEVAGYQGYAFLRARLGSRAVTAAQRAVRLDQFYADGYIPLGIALLGEEQRPPGVQALRRGLILLEDADRAARLISAYLNPTDP